MAVREGGRAARTEYRVLAEAPGASLVEVRPETGRTHQIRVHLASIGHPVAGDAVYGRPAMPTAARQMLHAWRLRFPHPMSGDDIEVEAPMPADFLQVLQGSRLPVPAAGEDRSAGPRRGHEAVGARLGRGR
jgi:23S rRNA pseudouridine1911/1915/1917 synthase